MQRDGSMNIVLTVIMMLLLRCGFKLAAFVSPTVTGTSRSVFGRRFSTRRRPSPAVHVEPLDAGGAHLYSGIFTAGLDGRIRELVHGLLCA